jgi:hypothetical protein
MTPDLINAIATLVGAVGWPLAIVTIVFGLRREIAGLLARVENFNIAGTAVAFNNKAAKAEILDAGENLAESPEGSGVVQSETVIDPTMSKMIDNDPVNAIAFSWRSVESALVDLAHQHGLVLDLRSARKSAAQLSSAGIISPEMAEAIKSLYSTYKRAIHSYTIDFERASIEDYVRIANETERAILKLTTANGQAP